MKRRIKKLFSTFLLIGIFILLFTSLFFLKFTGHVIKETEKNIQFYFYDESTNCSLNGYIFIDNKPVGKTYQGYFNLTYSNYLANFKNRNNLSIFGELGTCFRDSNLLFNKYWALPKIETYNFLGDSVFYFKVNINPHNPVKKELQGFIQPEKVKNDLSQINLNNNTKNDLSQINKYLDGKINYKKDWGFNNEFNYWQTPEETLKIKQGDCEDFSTTILSLFSAYDSFLNCYNVIFTSHVTTFCHFDDYYVYYDQGKTESIKQITNNNQKINQLSELNKDYFKSYGLNETQAHYVFNNIEIIEFKQDSDYLNWQYNLKNSKDSKDIFQELEKQIIINTQNLSQVNLQGELKTQIISLPSSKNFPYLIIFLFIILIIIFIFLIKVIKQK